MSRTTALCRRWLRLLPITAILAVSSPSSAPQAGPVGVPDDWSHRHVVFSNPGTAAEALRNGTYAQWVRTVNNPRFIMQQQKRAAAARAGMISPSLLADAESTDENAQFADFPVQEVKRGFPIQGAAEGSEQSGLRIPPHRRVRGHRLQTDWSEDLGKGATLGMGVYAAKFSFSLSTANCGADYVVYNTSLAGVAGPGGQASIVAFNNLYSGCGGTVPSVNWAYDTNGGTIVTSVILSYSDNGKQVAFVQSAGGAASLVVLRWAASTGTLADPVAPANLSPAMYYNGGAGCTAPCMTTIALSGGNDDTGSSPFYDYTPGKDTLYVGDDQGVLHKFTGVFSGTPAEVTASPWPKNVSANGNGLSSPVLDSNAGNVLVGDYQAISEPNCGLGCGFLYRVNAATGSVVQSAQLEFGFGIVDAPLLDLAASTVYVFAGADSNVNSAASPCGKFLSCSGVIQLSTTFLAAATGTEETLGLGSDFMYAGTFDNAYFTSANHASPTGNLYALGQTGGDITLYQIPIASNVMSAANAGPVISNNFTNGFTSPAMPVTEIFSGGHDYIFTSALLFAKPLACGGGSMTQGCVMGFDVTGEVISAGTTPTGATSEAGGVSGIIIDNTSGFAGASNIYYTPLADQLCPDSGGMGGCAIQISQSAP